MGVRAVVLLPNLPGRKPAGVGTVADRGRLCVAGRFQQIAPVPRIKLMGLHLQSPGFEHGDSSMQAVVVAESRTGRRDGNGIAAIE